MKTLNDNFALKDSSRLQMRVTPERRNLLEQAARLTGRSLSQFVLDSAEQAAIRTIEEQRVLRLTQRDSDFLVAALLNPPVPGERLRKAATRYQEMMD
ncbi:MAG: DUF1778 domain-containing protein [Magnetococcus sp. DMHC-1]|nr:DUF1778 domain-containing protein [Magnetococcales bacterium]